MENTLAYIFNGGVYFVIMLIIIVLLHELGHFFTAKKSGVKVQEFGIGIPPKLGTIYKDKSGTEYTINLLPLGGFVRLKGENPDNQEEFMASDSFITQNIWKKLIILAGGVTMNLITAWILFTMAFHVGMQPLSIAPENLLISESYMMPNYDFLEKNGLISGNKINEKIEVLDVLPDTIAFKMGLLSGDKITAINDKQINTLTLSKELKKLFGQQFILTYERNGKTLTGEGQCQTDSCLLGVQYSGGRYEIKDIKFDFIGAMGAAGHEIIAQTKITLPILKTLGKNLLSFNKEKLKETSNQLVGAAGSTKIADQVYIHYGLGTFLAFCGMISLALAIFNFLPIPALDGGRAVGVIIQTLFKLKPEKYFVIENYLNLPIFIILLVFGIYILLNDLVRFWGFKIWGF